MDLLVDICAHRARARALSRPQRRRARRGDQPRTSTARCAAPPSCAPSSPSASARRRDYETALNAARIWMKERHFRIGVHLLRGLAERRGGGRRLFRRRRGGARARCCRVVAARLRRAATGPPPGAGAVVVAHGQARQPRDDGQLRPRPDRDLRRRGRRGLERPAPARRHRLLRPPHPGADRGADRADGRGRPLQGRHAAAPLRPAGAGRDLARRLPPLPGRGGLDLGAPGADPRPRRRRPGGARRRASPRRSPRRSTAPHDPAKVLADARDMRRRLAEAHEAAAADPWEVEARAGADDGHRAARPDRRADPRPRRAAPPAARCSTGSARSAGSRRRRRRARGARSTGSRRCSRSAGSPATAPSTRPRAAPGWCGSCSPPPAQPDLDSLRADARRGGRGRAPRIIAARLAAP